jgi:predicted amidohydrolase
LLLLLAAPGAQAKTVRVFAMQPKLDVAWMQSRETYHDKMFALADAQLRTPDKPLIQRGAADVASHLLGPGRDLVVWPEDIGLFGALTGDRASSARAGGSLEGAIISLVSTYAPQNAYYAQKYPAVAARSLPVRLTFLSLTDTFARTTVETFSEMAARYHVYLEAGANIAQSWQVVCNDIEAFNRADPPRLPGGVLCQEQNPQKVVQLRDPQEPARDYAYEATSSKVSNMALLFGPNGRLISKQPKTYLTENEVPGQLDLVPGEVTGGLSAVKTPVGTLGFVTSKDAWMPDVQAKLDEQHVDLLVQPEFFVNDLVSADKMWSPDTLKASGYNDVLRLPSVKAMVLPELTGNIFNFSADAQSHFVVRSARARGGLVGQPRVPGLLPSPWVIKEPTGSFAARRKRLAAAGAALAPGSGVACADPAVAAPCENGHVEGVFRRDIEVNVNPRFKRYRGPVRSTPLSRARPVTKSRSAQRNAALAMSGRRAVLAWEEGDRVFVARSANGGRSWSRALAVAPLHGGKQQWPAVALAASGRVTVAWSDTRTGTPRVMYARSRGAKGFTAARALDSSAPTTAAQWKPSLAAGRGDTVHAVWIDERELSADDSLPQAHVLYARVGQTAPGRKLDTGTPVTLAQRSDNAWAPRVASSGKRVIVTWLDFETYDWGVFSRLSANGGASFAKQTRVTSDGPEQEELADSPAPALPARGKPLIAWTDWRKRDSAGKKPHQEYDTFIATPGGKNHQVDPYGGRQVSTFAPSVCLSGGRATVAFQDASSGRNVVRAVTLRGAALKRGRARLVSDAGTRGGNAWRPQLACSGGRAVAVWEDERDGPPRLYSSFGSARRLW